MMCPECQAMPGYYIDQTRCERCNRKLIRREYHKKILYRILDLFRFHKHDFVLIKSELIEFKPHGKFVVAMYMCKNGKCRARDWSISGLIGQIDNWEREHGLDKR